MRREMLDNVDSRLLQRFEVIKKVGQGAYGQVWKARDKRTGCLCALKKIYDAFRNPTDAQRAYREIKYLQRLNHPNIVRLLSFCRPDCPRDVYLSLEWMQSDLASAIRANVLKEIHKHFVFFQVASAVHYLHSAQLIHRDIKPANILLSDSCEAKLCDFGLVRSLHPDRQPCSLTENIATRCYRAPEILLCSNSYGKEVDVWSLGCVLAELFLGRPLFQGSSAIAQLERIFEVTGKPAREELEFVRSEASRSIVESMAVGRKKTLAEIFHGADEQMVDLLQRIFQVNPRRRITIDQIVRHPFVNRFKGRTEERRSNEPIRILHEAEKLTVEQYRALLYCELEEKGTMPELVSGKSSEMSTFYESSITHSLPNNSRQQFFGNTSPLARHDRQKPDNSFVPLPAFPSLQEIAKEESSLKSTCKRAKILHDLRVPKPQFPFESSRNLCIRQRRDKSADSRGFKAPEIHRTFTPVRARDYSSIVQRRKAGGKCGDPQANPAARQNEHYLRVVGNTEGEFPKAGSNRASPLKSNEQSRKDFHPKRTLGAKEERAKIVPKFILEGRKKFRSGSPFQLPEDRQDSAVLSKQKTISYLQPSGFPRLPQRQPSAVSPFK